MDALILSCGTGGGHDSAAKAIVDEMNIRGHKAVLLNPYTLKSDRLASGIDKTYITTACNTPRIFGVVYKLGDMYRRLPFRSPVYFVNRGMNEILQEYFAANHFDIVITTHLFGAEILTNMKQHGISVPKSIFVATDYVCIPFTEETDCDAYVIPADDLSSDFIGRGIPKEKIYPFGIPTQRKFAANESRDVIRQRLGLDADKKYVLVAGGSMGGGKINRAISKLCAHFADKDNIGLIIICGSNKELFERQKAQSDSKTIVVGHTDDMASYIKASDLFITKPGGLSSTEAAVSGIPIFHTCAIPGCETRNAHYFADHGMSVFGDTCDMLSMIDEILNGGPSSKGATMIACQRRYIQPCAAAKICEFAEKMIDKGKSL